MINLVSEDCRKSCTEVSSFEILNHQTILVTGGTGFMGKWIAEMVCYINSTYLFQIKLILLGRDIEKFKKEVPHLAKKSFIHLVEQDVRNLHDLPEEIAWVIHAAGTPDNREHASQPLRTIETIYKGTHAILDACFRLPNLQKLVHISSHTVYGKVESHSLIKESEVGKVECNTVNSAYAESKRMAETLCAIYRNQQHLPIIIVRPFAFVGPYQSLEKPWAINNFIRDALLGGPIRILGNGATIRSYLYGSDMAFWLLKILVKGKSGNTYNIGSGESISLNDLAKKITELIDKKISIISKSAKESYPDFTMAVPDTLKVMKDTDVKELFDLSSALQRTINWNQLLEKGDYGV